MKFSNEEKAGWRNDGHAYLLEARQEHWAKKVQQNAGQIVLTDNGKDDDKPHYQNVHIINIKT